MIRKIFLALFLTACLAINVFTQSYTVLYKCNRPEASHNTISPFITIVNNSGATVAMSDLEVRYYYTKEGATGNTFQTYYCSIGSSNLVMTYPPGYISFKFTTGAGNIVNGANSGAIELGIYKTDYSLYTQTNDYSFDSTKTTAYVAHDKIALFKSGVKVYGTEGPMPTPTPVPTAAPTQVTGNNFDYGDALKKAIWFYDANKCGPNVTVNNVVSWRTACHTTDGSEVSKDLSGGFHDAGDHVKFGLPQAYAASTLGWALYEFKSEFDRIGMTTKMLDTLKYFTDYFIKCAVNSTTFYYQVGLGGAANDHGYWGSPEVQTGARPVMAPATNSDSCTDITALTASALSLMNLNIKASNPTYAATCLTTATNLHNMALINNSRGSDGTARNSTGSFYGTSSSYDDLSWSAIWLSIAKNDATIRSQVPYWQTIPGDYGGSNFQFAWAGNWDNVTPYVMVKLAQLTGEQQYKDAVAWTLNWFVNTAPKSGAGLPYLAAWGPLRYASSQAGTAYAAYKILGLSQMNTLADLSVNYILGNNPANRSYITNWCYNPPVHPHHRANEPARYTGGAAWGLIGGLVGGPASNDTYTDDIANYERNEVSIDFNASLILGLAGKMWLKNGGAPVPTPTRTATSAATATRTGTAASTPTAAPTPTRTATSAATATRTATAGPTATRTATSAATATRTGTIAATATRTATRTATAAPTATPTAGAGTCSPSSTVTINYAFTGIGDFCVESASLGTYINGWSATSVFINGVDCTNKWVSSNTIAPIGGKYYIRYISSNVNGHVEINN